MVAAGISRKLLAELGVHVQVAIRAEGVDALAVQHGITRSAAGILALADRLDGAVVAIGNAPTALLALLDLCAAGCDSPRRHRRHAGRLRGRPGVQRAAAGVGAPGIVVRGTRGGSPLAAATVNYLLGLAARPRAAPEPHEVSGSEVVPS